MAKKTKKINFTRSETWLGDNYAEIEKILQETIKAYICKNERIINIEVKESDSGLKRFWIYSEEITPLQVGKGKKK